MYKTRNFFIVISILALGFSACKNENIQIQPDIKENVEVYSAYYWTEEGTNDMAFYTEGAVENGIVRNDSAYMYALSIKVPQPYETLPNGTYTEKDLDKQYSFIANINDFILQKKNNYSWIKSAKIVVESNKIEATITTNRDSIFQITLNGELLFQKGEM